MSLRNTNFKKILKLLVLLSCICSPIIETGIFVKKSIRRTHTIDFS